MYQYKESDRDVLRTCLSGDISRSPAHVDKQKELYGQQNVFSERTGRSLFLNI